MFKLPKASAGSLYIEATRIEILPPSLNPFVLPKSAAYPTMSYCEFETLLALHCSKGDIHFIEAYCYLSIPFLS